jgi:hypothetical protein
MFRGIVGKNPTCPFDENSQYLNEAEDLIKEVERSSGVSPSLFCLTSHPPAAGELQYLNVELVRHALWVLRKLRGGKGRGRLVIGMDYFALDMLALYEEAAYAGFTGTYHLGFDRLSHLRVGLGRLMLRGAKWPNMAGRLLSCFCSGGEVAMVLAGGVPETGRLFFCAREFLGRLYRGRPTGAAPREIRQKLMETSQSFQEFIASKELGGAASKSIRRAMEAWVINQLIDGDQVADVEVGRVNAAGRKAIEACFDALGYQGEEAERAFQDFSEEFSRATPYRERFFDILARRVVGRGRPVVILPLTHGSEENIHMKFGAPVCLLNAKNGRLGIQRPGMPAEDVDVKSFFRDFVSREYQ